MTRGGGNAALRGNAALGGGCCSGGVQKAERGKKVKIQEGKMIGNIKRG